MRPDIYQSAHKGLRHALGNLQQMAGQTDFNDLEEVNALHDEMVQLWDLLDFHADGEDELVHPKLEKADKSVYDSLENEHDELTIAEKNVLKELTELKDLSGIERLERSTMFVKRLNDYIARYYMHLQREELEAMPVLWSNYADPELLQILGEFPKKATPQIMGYFLKYMLPAVNHYERVAMVGSMRQNLPEPAFNNIQSICETQLSEKDWGKLKVALEL